MDSLESSLRSHVDRRAFLKRGSLFLAGTVGFGTLHAVLANAATPAKSSLRVGMITDVHYANLATKGTRYYRDSIQKVREATKIFKQSNVAFALELGDFIDVGPNLRTEIGHLKRIETEFATGCKDRHHVLGNHCVFNLTKQEFLDTIGAKEPHYSFDRGNFHIVVLDACFRADGVAYQRKNFDWTDANIPMSQLEWLKNDLASTKKTDNLRDSPTPGHRRAYGRKQRARGSLGFRKSRKRSGSIPRAQPYKRL